MYWNPSRTAFILPGIDHPIAWYGILFAVGFTAAYFLMRYLLNKQLASEGLQEPLKAAKFLTDKLCLYLVIGTVVGARLGEVLFYQWPFYREHPLEIFALWHGGLSSHGGIAGILIALFFFRYKIKKEFPRLTFLRLTDSLVIAASFTAVFIRIGNFINQEIIGHITTLPWGVFFADPIDGTTPAIRHPVQLYEALCYLLTGLILWYFWKPNAPIGRSTGLFFAIAFGTRFLLEWLKTPQGVLESHVELFTTGQLLTLPLLLFSSYLLLRPKKCL